MQTVSQLYHYHADVFRHSHKHLAEVLDLLRSVLVEDGGNFGQTFNNAGNLWSEHPFDVGYCVVGVFDHVVQKCAGNGFSAKSDFGSDNLCNGYRVDYVWFTTFASHLRVGFVCQFESLAYEGNVIFGLQPFCRLYKVVVKSFYISLFFCCKCHC